MQVIQILNNKTYLLTSLLTKQFLKPENEQLEFNDGEVLVQFLQKFKLTKIETKPNFGNEIKIRIIIQCRKEGNTEVNISAILAARQSSYIIFGPGYIQFTHLFADHPQLQFSKLQQICISIIGHQNIQYFKLFAKNKLQSSNQTDLSHFSLVLSHFKIVKYNQRTNLTHFFFSMQQINHHFESFHIPLFQQSQSQSSYNTLQYPLLSGKRKQSSPINLLKIQGNCSNKGIQLAKCQINIGGNLIILRINLNCLDDNINQQFYFELLSDYFALSILQYQIIFQSDSTNFDLIQRIRIQFDKAVHFQRNGLFIISCLSDFLKGQRESIQLKSSSAFSYFVRTLQNWNNLGFISRNIAQSQMEKRFDKIILSFLIYLRIVV
ncbi:unnamed protein product [Paramecium octaurelia]|uniref:Uncharacterized protein n=1 Tax=Paramecium octaurelia TaxID=43137 RepID=A0A8S1XJ34_PAROT|nr:unnamed protein product [Paramecium octaurelia]